MNVVSFLAFILLFFLFFTLCNQKSAIMFTFQAVFNANKWMGKSKAATKKKDAEKFIIFQLRNRYSGIRRGKVFLMNGRESKLESKWNNFPTLIY